jgi:hypothetical protein
MINMPTWIRNLRVIEKGLGWLAGWSFIMGFSLMVVMPILEGRSPPDPLGTIGIYLLFGSGALYGVISWRREGCAGLTTTRKSSDKGARGKIIRCGRRPGATNEVRLS